MKRRVVHWVRSWPENLPAFQRGFYCGVKFSSHILASPYRDRITCKACIKRGEAPAEMKQLVLPFYEVR